MLEAWITSLLGGISLLLLWRRVQSSRPSSSAKSVALVVLGDIGRSPRMLYHAQSFVEHGYTTHIVAYRGSAPPKALAENPHTRFVYLPTPLGWISGLPRPLFLLCAPFKVVFGAFGLLWALSWRIRFAPSYIFIQNPPAIPTLPVVKLAAILRGGKVIIDWHNTGYSVLALRLGSRHPVVKLAKAIELFFGRSAYAHLCVTDAMKDQLVAEAHLKGRIATFHDRPPSHFRRQAATEAHELFSRLEVLHSLSFPSPSAPDPAPLPSPDTTLFSSPTGLLPDRPALLVSATSWTADEDFSILLGALELYESAARAYAAGEGAFKHVGGEERGRLPRVVVVITGKGEGKKAFEAEVERREKAWEWVRVRTAWLALDDYPKLLGSADLGISLHTSSSGVDLPMKVVDMFGCGLPVVALDFACIGELVQDGTNGRTFRTAQNLADRLVSLLRGFPDASPSDLDVLGAGIRDAKYGGDRAQAWCSWGENWDQVVAPLVAP
ncbi:hypothetical protein JCM5296_002648 [Sporobolomyces johnsonii]